MIKLLVFVESERNYNDYNIRDCIVRAKLEILLRFIINFQLDLV